MWSGTARFRNPHIKWPEAMAGIPLKLQVEKRKEGKRESKETKRKSNAYIYRPGHVTCHVTNMWLVTWVRKPNKEIKFIYTCQARPGHVTCHVTNIWPVTWPTCDPSQISPFISLFLHTNPGFFEPFLSIIVNLGHPISVVLANGILSAGLRRRVISQRVISVISEKRRKACRGRRCIIIYELGH